MSFDSIYVSWVDLVVFLVVLIGIRRGQKRGISEELLSVLQWVTIIFAAGIGYGPVGEFLASFRVFSLLFCYIAAYILIAIAVSLVFSAIRKSVGDKLLESDAFGSGEYFCGMLAGGVRYAAVLVVVLSLLNARHYSQSERYASSQYQQNNFGSNILPTLFDLQDEVFARSYSGRFTYSYLSSVLIAPTPASDAPIGRDARVQARERAINEILAK